MGIVVSVIMLLGLCLLLPIPWVRSCFLKKTSSAVNVISVLLLLGGLWNSLWFGLQHLTDFWGLAALVSGVLMVLASLILLMQHGSGRLLEIVVLQKAYALLQPLNLFITIALLLCFLLYAVTLVQLNLGMPILQ